MAEFTEHMQRFRPVHESFTAMDMDIQILKQNQQLLELNPSTLGGSFSVADFSLDSFFAHQQQADRFSSAPNFVHNNSLSNTFHHPDIFSSGPTVHPVPPTSSGNVLPDACKKKKEEAQSTGSSKNVSPLASTTGTKKKNNADRGQKGKKKEKEVDKAEVIHVRAKRGQATDSHSIAERVRREKINHKLRCLQDLVPGCHKSMGMAVMLEEIINYVHSLQNQVEFLSMELAAASCSYDLNLETESSKKVQQGTNSAVAQAVQKLPRGRYGELGGFQSTWSL